MFACKKLEETLFLQYFSVKKSTKSQQGGLSPSSLQTSCTRELTNARSALVGVAETGGKPSYMTFGILRLGDAVQRWLRHPEPSSSSQKSTIKKNILMFLFKITLKTPHQIKIRSGIRSVFFSYPCKNTG